MCVCVPTNCETAKYEKAAVTTIKRKNVCFSLIDIMRYRTFFLVVAFSVCAVGFYRLPFLPSSFIFIYSSALFSFCQICVAFCSSLLCVRARELPFLPLIAPKRSCCCCLFFSSEKYSTYLNNAVSIYANPYVLHNMNFIMYCLSCSPLRCALTPFNWNSKLRKNVGTQRQAFGCTRFNVSWIYSANATKQNVEFSGLWAWNAVNCCPMWIVTYQQLQSIACIALELPMFVFI